MKRKEQQKILSLEELIIDLSRVVIELNKDFNLDEIKELLSTSGDTKKV